MIADHPTDFHTPSDMARTFQGARSRYENTTNEAPPEPTGGFFVGLSVSIRCSCSVDTRAALSPLDAPTTKSPRIARIADNRSKSVVVLIRADAGFLSKVSLKAL